MKLNDYRRLRRRHDHHREEMIAMPSAIMGVTFDYCHARPAASSCAGAPGRTVSAAAAETRPAVDADPAIPGSRIGFQQVPEDKTVKNRMHFDLATSDFDAEVTRLTGLGPAKA